MTRVAIGPETCGLVLKPEGIREIRRRRGLGTWFYEEDVSFKPHGFRVKRYVQVPEGDESLAEHSHAEAYESDMGPQVSPDEMGDSGRRAYPHGQVRDRTDPILIDMVLDTESDWFAYAAKVVDIPEGVDWYVREDEDGSESVHESHRT